MDWMQIASNLTPAVFGFAGIFCGAWLQGQREDNQTSRRHYAEWFNLSFRLLTAKANINARFRHLRARGVIQRPPELEAEELRLSNALRLASYSLVLWERDNEVCKEIHQATARFIDINPYSANSTVTDASLEDQVSRLQLAFHSLERLVWKVSRARPQPAEMISPQVREHIEKLGHSLDSPSEAASNTSLDSADTDEVNAP